MTFAPFGAEKVWIGTVFLLSLAFCLVAGNQAEALIASPARIEIEADPGERVKSMLSLVNNEDKEKTFFSSTENFEAGGESGVPKFVPSEKGLDTWIEVASQVTLDPGERKEIPFTIDTPADAGVGGHFSAIFWSTKPPKAEGGQIAVGAKVGILAFLRVRGDIIEKGEIIEIGTLTKKKMFDSLPVDIFYRFENQGNDRTKPIGELKIKNMLGGGTEKITANEKQGSVLPESIRKFYVSWGREDFSRVEDMFKKGTLYPEKSFAEKVKDQATHFALGRYTADLSLEYGQGKKIAESEISFWVIPWQLLIVVLMILIVVVFGGRMMLRRYNKRVIARAQKAQSQRAEE